jgi:hypothetical protein
MTMTRKKNVGPLHGYMQFVCEKTGINLERVGKALRGLVRLSDDEVENMAAAAAEVNLDAVLRWRLGLPYDANKLRLQRRPTTADLKAIGNKVGLSDQYVQRILDRFVLPSKELADRLAAALTAAGFDCTGDQIRDPTYVNAFLTREGVGAVPRKLNRKYRPRGSATRQAGPGLIKDGEIFYRRLLNLLRPADSQALQAAAPEIYKMAWASTPAAALTAVVDIGTSPWREMLGYLPARWHEDASGFAPALPATDPRATAGAVAKKIRDHAAEKKAAALPPPPPVDPDDDARKAFATMVAAASRRDPRRGYGVLALVPHLPAATAVAIRSGLLARHSSAGGLLASAREVFHGIPGTGGWQELDDALTLAFARLVVADFEGGGKLAQGAAEQKSGV